ncbi:DUF1800 domain-containing protein [Nocardioides stalactiti]|uniref:DUF1800 domain-containing protein n=1 Tax=Nocardioides stalactiti TaxID=2755356 RepID=UPI0016019E07|nr:DUF1800 domain-containing protein [Nocardioides stalactiti]
MSIVPVAARTKPPVRRRGLAVAEYERRAAPVILSAADRHLVRRFTHGLTPELAAQVKAVGGGMAWFQQQLTPALVADAPGAATDNWFPTLRKTPAQIFQDNQDGVRGGWEVANDLSKWTVARRMLSNRQVHEVMVDFWSNLLNVTLFHDDALFWRKDFDKVIRTNALTSYEKLLQAAVTHPAMGLYLDNAFSSKEAPNENLGREVLELHTVGVDGGYTEDDVKASARMLTGYRVDVWWPEFRAYYDRSWHDTQPVKVLGFTHQNSSSDGRPATMAYLSYLAKHPATAARLARRLCVRFVSDTPSAALVAAVAKAYLDNGTAIRPTLLAMVRHPDFALAVGRKVRTPLEDYIATVRALGIKPLAPVSEDSYARAMYWQYSEMGQPPYEWPTPDGYPEVDSAWASAGRVLTSFTLHRDLSARWWPTQEVRYPSKESMLPAMPAPLGTVIDTISMHMLGQKPTAPVRNGIAELLGIPLTKSMTKAEALTYWTFTGIQTSLLDSPLHMHK